MTPSVPPKRALVPLPTALWESWEVERAVAEASPGTIIAIARRAYGLRQDELGAMAGFSQSAVSRLESGGNLAYDIRILRIFQSLLGIPAHLLGLADAAAEPRPAPNGVGSGDELDARSLLMVYAPAAVRAARHERGPIDSEVVGQLLVARRVINDLDNWVPSVRMLAVVRQLHDFVDQLRSHAIGERRRELLNVAALYAEFCGWQHMRTGDLTEASAWTTRALQQAQAADNRELVAYAYRRMSQLAQLEGDEDRAAGLARAATREHGVGPQVRAMALQQEARTYARRGEEAMCQARLAEAADLVSGIVPRPMQQYRLASWFSSHLVEMERAECCVELGRFAEALALHEREARRWSPNCRWGLGVHLGKMAIAHAGLGDLEQAAAAGSEALALGSRTGCLLITRELRRLRRWARTPAIAGIVNAVDSVNR